MRNGKLQSRHCFAEEEGSAESLLISGIVPVVSAYDQLYEGIYTRQ